jgi:hypothetical protein
MRITAYYELCREGIMYKFIDVKGVVVGTAKKPGLKLLQEFVGGTVSHVGNYYYNPMATEPNQYNKNLNGNIVEVIK